ncbi:MAG: hypothetical protein FWC71_07790 [Defluviitaleaceae bacterium]|nr:hypothetical protein [Defluviitaleaceae bacterium]
MKATTSTGLKKKVALILAFVMMTATLGFFAWGYEEPEAPTYPSSSTTSPGAIEIAIEAHGTPGSGQYNLANFLTGVQIRDDEGLLMEEGHTLELGRAYSFAITFASNIGPGGLFEYFNDPADLSHPWTGYLIYRLPQEMEPSSPIHGSIVSTDETIGTYTVNTDGYLFLQLAVLESGTQTAHVTFTIHLEMQLNVDVQGGTRFFDLNFGGGITMGFLITNPEYMFTWMHMSLDSTFFEPRVAGNEIVRYTVIIGATGSHEEDSPVLDDVVFHGFPTWRSVPVTLPTALEFPAQLRTNTQVQPRTAFDNFYFSILDADEVVRVARTPVPASAITWHTTDTRTDIYIPPAVPGGEPIAATPIIDRDNFTIDFGLMGITVAHGEQIILTYEIDVPYVVYAIRNFDVGMVQNNTNSLTGHHALRHPNRYRMIHDFYADIQSATATRFTSTREINFINTARDAFLNIQTRNLRTSDTYVPWTISLGQTTTGPHGMMQPHGTSSHVTINGLPVNITLGTDRINSGTGAATAGIVFPPLDEIEVQINSRLGNFGATTPSVYNLSHPMFNVQLGTHNVSGSAANVDNVLLFNIPADYYGLDITNVSIILRTPMSPQMSDPDWFSRNFQLAVGYGREVSLTPGSAEYDYARRTFATAALASPGEFWFRAVTSRFIPATVPAEERFAQTYLGTPITWRVSIGNLSGQRINNRTFVEEWDARLASDFPPLTGDAMLMNQIPHGIGASTDGTIIVSSSPLHGIGGAAIANDTISFLMLGPDNVNPAANALFMENRIREPFTAQELMDLYWICTETGNRVYALVVNKNEHNFVFTIPPANVIMPGTNEPFGYIYHVSFAYSTSTQRHGRDIDWDALFVNTIRENYIGYAGDILTSMAGIVRPRTDLLELYQSSVRAAQNRVGHAPVHDYEIAYTLFTEMPGALYGSRVTLGLELPFLEGSFANDNDAVQARNDMFNRYFNVTHPAYVGFMRILLYREHPDGTRHFYQALRPGDDFTTTVSGDANTAMVHILFGNVDDMSIVQADGIERWTLEQAGASTGHAWQFYEDFSVRIEFVLPINGNRLDHLRESRGEITARVHKWQYLHSITGMQQNGSRFETTRWQVFSYGVSDGAVPYRFDMVAEINPITRPNDNGIGTLPGYTNRGTPLFMRPEVDQGQPSHPPIFEVEFDSRLELVPGSLVVISRDTGIVPNAILPGQIFPVISNQFFGPYHLDGTQWDNLVDVGAVTSTISFDLSQLNQINGLNNHDHAWPLSVNPMSSVITRNLWNGMHGGLVVTDQLENPDWFMKTGSVNDSVETTVTMTNNEEVTFSRDVSNHITIHYQLQLRPEYRSDEDLSFPVETRMQSSMEGTHTNNYGFVRELNLFDREAMSEFEQRNLNRVFISRNDAVFVNSITLAYNFRPLQKNIEVIDNTDNVLTTIHVNTGAHTLLPADAYNPLIRVVDTMLFLTPDMDTMRLYVGSLTEAGVMNWQLLDRNSDPRFNASLTPGPHTPWSILDFGVNLAGEHVLHFIVPDGTPIRIMYESMINAPAGSTVNVRNSVSLYGLGFETWDDVIGHEVRGLGIVGAVDSHPLAITKRASHNPAILLPGAEFHLYIHVTQFHALHNQYAGDGMGAGVRYRDIGGQRFFFAQEGITDANGQLVFDHLNILPRAPLVYLLVEVDAPAGYILPTGSDAYTFLTFSQSLTQSQINETQALLRGDVDDVIIGRLPLVGTLTLENDIRPTPSIEIRKHVNREVFIPGETVRYTLEVINDGFEHLFDVVVTDPLDTMLILPRDFVHSANAPGTTQNFDNHTLTATIPSLPIGAMVTFTFYVTINEDAAIGMYIPNTANVSAVANEGILADYASVSILVESAPQPIIDITKSASPEGVAASGIVRYTLRVQNRGNRPLSNVRVVDNLPAQFTQAAIVSMTLDALDGAPVTPASGGLTGTTLDMTFDALPLDGVIFIVLDATLGSQVAIGTEIENTATASAVYGTTAVDDTDTAIITVVDIPRIDITKTATPATIPQAGGTVIYTLVVTNTGHGTINNATVIDTLPAALQFANMTILPEGASYTINGQRLTVNLASLAQGASVSIEFNVTVAPNTTPGHITNVATVTSGTLTANDNATITVLPPEPAPAVNIIKEAYPQILPRDADEAITYTFTVTNTGNVTLEGLIITDNLPPQLQFVSGSVDASGATYSFNADNRQLRVYLADLPVNTSVEVTFRATIAEDASADDIINAVLVSNGTVSSNSSATVTLSTSQTQNTTPPSVTTATTTPVVTTATPTTTPVVTTATPTTTPVVTTATPTTTPAPATLATTTAPTVPGTTTQPQATSPATTVASVPALTATSPAPAVPVVTTPAATTIAPPTPGVPGNRIIPEGNPNVWLELNPAGVPIGQWTRNNNWQFELFNREAPPTAVAVGLMPQTGLTAATLWLAGALNMMLVAALGMLVFVKRKKLRGVKK